MSLERFRDSKASTCFSVSFPKAFCEGEYGYKFGFFIIWFRLENNISSPVRYSYLSILADDNADIFATSLLILYCSFLFLILSSIVLISFLYSFQNIAFKM